MNLMGGYDLKIGEIVAKEYHTLNQDSTIDFLCLLGEIIDDVKRG